MSWHRQAALRKASRRHACGTASLLLLASKSAWHQSNPMASSAGIIILRLSSTSDVGSRDVKRGHAWRTTGQGKVAAGRVHGVQILKADGSDTYSGKPITTYKNMQQFIEYGAYCRWPKSTLMLGPIVNLHYIVSKSVPMQLS